MRLAYYAAQYRKFLGPGVFVALGYMDPGNWATSISAGSRFGYVCLFCILVSNVFAVVLQAVTAKLGVVSGFDLAQLTKRHTGRVMNIILYIAAEAAIIACDIAEVIGSSIALELLFGIDIILGIVITGLDVFILLLGFNMKNIGVFEILVLFVVLTIGGCFVFLLISSKPNIKDVILGFIPHRKLITDQKVLRLFVAIVGATVMPHNLYLHSYLVQCKFQPPEVCEESLETPKAEGSLYYQDMLKFSIPDNVNVPLTQDTASLAEKARMPREAQMGHLKSFFLSKWEGMKQSSKRLAFGDIKGVATDGMDIMTPTNPPNSPRVVPASWKKTLDKMIILLQFDSCVNLFYAFFISCAILVVSASAFRKVEGRDVDLHGAFYALSGTLGKPVGLVYAIALLLCGQSSTIAGTIAGQVVMCGHLGSYWGDRIKPWVRRLVTRQIAIIPAIIFSVWMGDKGVESLLIYSQIVLSVQLPLAMWPLILMSSNKKIMSVTFSEDINSPRGITLENIPTSPTQQFDSRFERRSPMLRIEKVPQETVDYSNGFITTAILFIVGIIITLLNVILLYQEIWSP